MSAFLSLSLNWWSQYQAIQAVYLNDALRFQLWSLKSSDIFHEHFLKDNGSVSNIFENTCKVDIFKEAAEINLFVSCMMFSCPRIYMRTVRSGRNGVCRSLKSLIASTFWRPTPGTSKNAIHYLLAQYTCHQFRKENSAGRFPIWEQHDRHACIAHGHTNIKTYAYGDMAVREVAHHEGFFVDISPETIKATLKELQQLIPGGEIVGRS